jgi:phosphoacetylglucosamine mutase
MLESKWEDYATTIANASGSKELVQAVISLSELIQLNWSTPARVIYGRDTRPSGADLVSSLVDGLSSLNATTIDYGVITTPILHYLVKCANTRGTEAPYGDESEEGYYSKLSNAFVDIMASFDSLAIA